MSKDLSGWGGYKTRNYIDRSIFLHKILGYQDQMGLSYRTDPKENVSFYLPKKLMEEIAIFLKKYEEENKYKAKLSKSDIIFIAVKEFLRNCKEDERKNNKEE